MVEADGPLLRACATRVADGSEGLQVSASQIILQRKRNRQPSIIRVQARCNFVTLRPNPVLTAAELQNRECILFFQMRRENLVVDLNA